MFGKSGYSMPVHGNPLAAGEANLIIQHMFLDSRKELTS